MTFHNLGELGSAEVIPFKRIRIDINLSWNEFWKKFEKELDELSFGDEILLQGAFEHHGEKKIKTDGNKLDQFFRNIERKLRQQDRDEPEGVKEDSDEIEEEEKVGLIPCPACGNKCSPRAAMCPKCGEPLLNVSASPDLTPSSGKVIVKETIKEIVKIKCPYCGILVDHLESKCPHCGGTMK